jgi:hypothetical protein
MFNRLKKPAQRATWSRFKAQVRHQHLTSLGRYVQLDEQPSTRVTAEADPAACRTG